jgi:hypothetical protein
VPNVSIDNLNLDDRREVVRNHKDLFADLALAIADPGEGLRADVLSATHQKIWGQTRNDKTLSARDLVGKIVRSWPAETRERLVEPFRAEIRSRAGKEATLRDELFGSISRLIPCWLSLLPVFPSSETLLSLPGGHAASYLNAGREAFLRYERIPVSVSEMLPCLGLLQEAVHIAMRDRQGPNWLSYPTRILLEKRPELQERFLGMLTHPEVLELRGTEALYLTAGNRVWIQQTLPVCGLLALHGYDFGPPESEGGHWWFKEYENRNDMESLIQIRLQSDIRGVPAHLLTSEILGRHCSRSSRALLAQKALSSGHISPEATRSWWKAPLGDGSGFIAHLAASEGADPEPEYWDLEEKCGRTVLACMASRPKAPFLPSPEDLEHLAASKWSTLRAVLENPAFSSTRVREWLGVFLTSAGNLPQEDRRRALEEIRDCTWNVSSERPKAAHPMAVLEALAQGPAWLDPFPVGNSGTLPLTVHLFRNAARLAWQRCSIEENTWMRFMERVLPKLPEKVLLELSGMEYGLKGLLRHMPWSPPREENLQPRDAVLAVYGQWRQKLIAASGLGLSGSAAGVDEALDQDCMIL